MIGYILAFIGGIAFTLGSLAFAFWVDDMKERLEAEDFRVWLQTEEGLAWQQAQRDEDPKWGDESEASHES